MTAQGPVTNVDLWIELMDLIDRSVALLEWIKVPSHIAFLATIEQISWSKRAKRPPPFIQRLAVVCPGP